MAETNNGWTPARGTTVPMRIPFVAASAAEAAAGALGDAKLAALLEDFDRVGLAVRLTDQARSPRCSCDLPRPAPWLALASLVLR